MDHANEDDDDGDIFIYRGGRAPVHITHALIDKSVIEIEDYSFNSCHHLMQIDTHDGIRRVGKFAFYRCKSLRRINLKSAVKIGPSVFAGCKNLESVEFGDMLETIGNFALSGCTSLTHVKLPSIITIGACAFEYCERLTDIKLPERLETNEGGAFAGCGRLQRIAIPLKRDLFSFDYVWQKCNQFDNCKQLTTVDLVGGSTKLLHRYTWTVGGLN